MNNNFPELKKFIEKAIGATVFGKQVATKVVDCSVDKHGNLAIPAMDKNKEV